MAGGQVERGVVEDVRPCRAVFLRTPLLGAVAYALLRANEDHAYGAQAYELHPIVRGAAREIVSLDAELLARRPRRAAHRLRARDGGHPLQHLGLEPDAAPLAHPSRALQDAVFDKIPRLLIDVSKIEGHI